MSILGNSRISRQRRLAGRPNKELETSVTFLDVDMVVKRKRNESSSSESRKGATGVKRGVATGPNKDSAFRLKLYIRNQPLLKFFHTVTFPDAYLPGTDEEAREVSARLIRKLRDSNLTGVFIIERSKIGRLHFHFLTDKGLSDEDLHLVWKAVLRAKEDHPMGAMINSQPIKDRLGLARYCAKSGYDMNRPTIKGRWWFKFGHQKTLPVRGVISGSDAVMAPIVRTAKKLENSRRKRRSSSLRKDGGNVGFTSLRTSQAVLEAFPEAKYVKENHMSPVIREIREARRRYREPDDE